MSDVTLYSYFRSSTSFRVRIALNLKKVSYEQKAVNLLKNEHNSVEYERVNSNKLVPTLVHGKTIITQSMAILEFLEEKHPDVKILPQSIEQKAWVRSFAYVIACDMHPLNNLRVLSLIESNYGNKGDKKSWMQYWFEKGFSVLEEMVVSQKSNAGFCIGNYPTMADICLIPQMYNGIRFKHPMEHYPRLSEIYDNCCKIAGFKEAFPEYQPDSLL